MKKGVIFLLAATLLFSACGDKTARQKQDETIDPSLYERVIKKDIIAGQGKEARKNMRIAVHYVLRLGGPEGNEIDNSRKRGNPLIFNLGTGQVIPGWDYGVQGMKTGGIRALTIPPELAYGDRQVSHNIPKNSTLYFEVELLEVFH